jgi:ABC-type transport system involved in multi-copper enzyme maturation permease subunit
MRSLNPVWLREMRAYWRGWRAFALMFFYTSILVGALVWGYNDFLSRVQEWDSNPTEISSRLGHSLFLMLSWMQVVGWMLIGPVLSATAIVGERERGLLESLQLTRLTAWRIVIGKLLSSLSMVLLLLVVILPITASCLLLGGVSPGEIALIFVLHLLTAITCISFGLACSAWFRRSGTAIGAALGGVISWGLALPIGGAILSGYASYTMLTLLARGWLTVCLYTNPVVAAVAFVEPNSFGTSSSTTISSPAGAVPILPPTEFLLLCVAFEALATVLLLTLATKGVRRPLPDPVWIELKRRGATTARQPIALRRSDEPATNDAAIADEAAANESQRELALLPWLNFSNPILQREVRTRLRIRRASSWILLLLLLLIPGAVYAYVSGIMYALTNPLAKDIIGPAVLTMLLLAVVVICPLFGAGAFTREREGGTWEGLSLSLLTPAQIVWGKLATPLVICSLVSLALLPMLLPCITGIAHTVDAHRGISVVQILAAILLCCATAWCYTMWGMLFSWWCRKSTVAVTWTLGTLLFLLLFLPTLASINSLESSVSDDFFRWWHPFFALEAIAFNSPPASNIWAIDYNFGQLAIICGVLGISGLIMFFLLRHFLKHGARERDAHVAPRARQPQVVEKPALVGE